MVRYDISKCLSRALYIRSEVIEYYKSEVIEYYKVGGY